MARTEIVEMTDDFDHPTHPVRLVMSRRGTIKELGAIGKRLRSAEFDYKIVHQGQQYNAKLYIALKRHDQKLVHWAVFQKPDLGLVHGHAMLEGHEETFQQNGVLTSSIIAAPDGSRLSPYGVRWNLDEGGKDATFASNTSFWRLLAREGSDNITFMQYVAVPEPLRTYGQHYGSQIVWLFANQWIRTIDKLDGQLTTLEQAAMAVIRKRDERPDELVWANQRNNDFQSEEPELVEESVS